MKKTYQIKEKVWVYPGKAAWHFVSIPPEVTEDIDFYFAMEKKGWGSLPVEVTIGNSVWTTSIFPDKKTKTYLLPLKAQVRKREAIVDQSLLSVQIVVGD